MRKLFLLLLCIIALSCNRVSVDITVEHLKKTSTASVWTRYYYHNRMVGSEQDDVLICKLDSFKCAKEANAERLTELFKSNCN